jgi:hypothetical protein
MKKLILILPLLMMSFNKPCYKVSSVVSSVEAPEMKRERVLFGIKQITEEILSEKFDLCEDGSPVTVEIISIEAPTVGVSIGPFMSKKKETLVKVKIIKDGIEYIGEGVAKVSVKATFIDLNDENLPFNKTAFAGAIKKSIEDSVSKM